MQLNLLLLMAVSFLPFPTRPVAEGIDQGEVQRIANAAAPSLLFYAAVIGVAIILPQVAAFGYLFIAVAAVLTARGEDPASERHRRRGRRHQVATTDKGAGDPPG